MLAKVLSDVLNAHLGTFIENLDTKQLGTSIYRGEVELKNMKLKKTMFKDSPLPFDLAYGHVGRIYLKVPIWDMFTSPLIIVVEDVFGLVRIKPTDEWQPNLQKQAYNDLVAEVLHQFELFVKNKEILAAKAKEQEESQSSATFGEKFIARIIDNIQISIRHIYFRFEDKMSGMHHNARENEKFAIGVRLKEFSVFTSDKNFKQITQDAANEVPVDAKDNDLTYKVAAIDGFSVFCDWHQVDLECNGGIDLKQLEDIKDQADPENYFYKILAGEFSTNAYERVRTHKYLIDGFKVSLHLQLNKNIKFPSMPASLDHPQIWAEIVIGDEAEIKKRSDEGSKKEHDDPGRSCQKHGNENALLLSIYQPQILRILKTLEIIGFFNEFKDGALNGFRTRKLLPDEKKEYLKWYTAWRPLEDSVKEQDVKTSKELREKMKKIENLTNDAELIAVRQTGIQMLQTTKGEQKERNNILEKIQAEIDERVGYGLFISKEQREQTEAAIRSKFQAQLSALESKYKTAKMGNLLKGSLKNIFDQERKAAAPEEAPVEEEKTVEQMDYDIEYNKLPMNYVLYQIDIKIPGIDFTIDNEFNQKLLVFNLDQFELNFKQSKQMMNVKIKLEDFEIKDNWSQSTAHPRLIEALEHENQLLQLMDEQDQQEVDQDLLEDILKDEKRHKRAQALKINYIADTSFKKCPFKLRVRVEKQLQIILLIPLINELQRTMDAAFSDQKLDFEYFQKYAQGRVKEFTDVAQTYAESIKKGDYQHTNADVDIKMYAPVVKIPENIFKEDSPYLEFNTGTLRVRSDLLEFDRANPNKYETIENDLELYDKYTINLEKLRLNLIFPGAVGKKKEIKIINDFTFCITVENCLAPLHKKFPTLRLDIDFKERIEFEFDFYCLKTIFRLKDLLLIQMDTSDLQVVEQKMKKKMEIVKKKAQIQNRRRTAAYAQNQSAAIAKAVTTAEAPVAGPEARWRMLRQRSRLLQRQQQRAQSSNAKAGQSQQDGPQIEIHDQVIHEAYSEHSQSSVGSQGVPGLVDHEKKVAIPALFQGNAVFSSQDDGNSKGINEYAQEKEESKKAKFLREQAEKSSNQGANMEINFSMKEMLLILKADSISKPASVDKSAAESPQRFKNSEASSNNNLNKNTFKRANQPSSKGMAAPNHKQDNTNDFESGLSCDGLNSDVASYSVTFEMRGLMTKIKLENNQNDVAVDFSVDTFQIKDGQSAQAKRAQRKEQRITKREQKQLEIFNKIMSSPLDDDAITGENQRDDDESLSEDGINQEQDCGHMKDNKANPSRDATRQHIDSPQGFANRREQQQANSTDEKELYVQCIMKSSQYWDDDYEEVVENSLMDVTCCINRSRLIVNIPTVSNFIKIYKQLMDFLEESPKNYDKLVIDNKNNMMKALSLQSYSQQPSDTREAYPLIKKIFMNLARQNGHHEGAEIEEYLSMVAGCLKETIEAKIWQSDIRKELQQSEVAQIERDGNELSKKSDKDKHESSSSSENESNQAGNGAQSESQPGLPMIQKDQKFAADPKDHKIGQPEKLPEHNGSIRSRIQINDSTYSSFSHNGNVSEERLNEQMLEQNEARTRQQSTAKPQAKKLYFVKETYWRYVMSVKVKLKNMELWIADYNNEPEKKAQILQLKFMSDLFYDSEQFGKEIHCSKKPLKQRTGLAGPPYNQEAAANSRQAMSMQLQNDKLLPDQIEDGLDDEKLEELDQGLLRMLNEEQTEIQEEYHVIRKILENKDHMQFNLSKLAIEQMIVQRWLEVSHIVWRLCDHAQQAENAVDRDEQQQMNTNTSGTSDTESLEDEGEGSIDKEESGEDSSHSVSEHLSHSHSDLEFRRNIDGIPFAQCPILKPTCVSILVKNESEYQECRFYMMNIDLENLFLTCDFKDIDLIYYLYKRYEQCIWPDLELLTPEVEVEDEGGLAEDKVNEKEQNHEQETQKRGQSPAPKNASGENRADLAASRYGSNGEQLIEKDKSTKLVDQVKGEDPIVKNSRADEIISEEGIETPPDSEDEEDYEIGDPVHSSSVETFKTDISNVAVKISSIVLSLSDGELENHLGSKPAWPTPLIELVINKLEYCQKSNITLGDQPRSKDVLAVPLDIYYGMGDFHQPVSDMKVSCGLYATYYNEMSQAFEPFIEPWSLNIKILQISEDDIQDIQIKSDQFLAINFTFGMALAIRDIRNRITDKTFKIDEELKKEKECFKEKNQKKDNENKNNTTGSISEHHTIPPWNGHEKPQENPKSENAHHTKTTLHIQQSQTQQPSLKQNKKNGYTFYNCLGGDVEFCVSDKELDENLAIKMAGEEEKDQRLRRLKPVSRQTQESLGNYKICIAGERKNDEKLISTISKDQAFFDIQKQNIQKRRQDQVHDTDAYFNDDIENEPLTIDIKIEGISKIANIPIEIVGVYSYSATTVADMLAGRCAASFASELEQQLDKQQMKQNQEGVGLAANQRITQPLPTQSAHDINIIVNINTEGKQRIINFESQLLFVNNMSYHITLLFRLRRLCSHASAAKSPTKKAAMLSRHSEQPQQLQNIPNNQRGQSSALQMKYHEVADLSKQPVTQKVVQLGDGDAEAEERAAVSRGPKSAEKSASANPAKHGKANGLEQPKLDGRRRSLHQQAHGHFDSVDGEVPQSISKSPDQHEQASDSDSVDLDEADRRQEISEERANSLVTVTLQPHDIYKIPLMWMMPDSAVDVSILKKKIVPGTNPREYEDIEDEEQIFEDIQNIFCKTAFDCKKPTFTDQIKSSIIKLDPDFYVSVDIQGYCCFPKQTQKTNPLQYVVSLNPPLMFTNYSMSPLELFEIDNPDTPDAVAVSQARIAPSMSAHIIELDLTDENESHIKLTFADTVKNQLLSTTIEKFSIPKSTVDNMVDDKRQKSEQEHYIFKIYQDEADYDMYRQAQKNKIEDATLKVKDLESCQIQVDTIKRVYSDIKAYHENFNFRTKLIDISIAVKIMIYPKFMIVNKSMHDIMIKGNQKGLHTWQTIKEKMNDFLFDASTSQKFVFKVQDYKESMPIDVEAIGVSGEIMIDHEQNDGKYSGKQLQFGINIAQAQWPFNKTTIVTIVPRYLLVNKLKRSIEVRQVANAYIQKPDKGQIKDQPDMRDSIKTLAQGATDEFHLMKSKQSSSKNKENKIQFRTLRATTDQRDIYEHSFAGEANDHEEDQINSAPLSGAQDPEWTTPFSVDALEDFQTETQLTAPGSNAQDKQRELQSKRLPVRILEPITRLGEAGDREQVKKCQVDNTAIRQNESPREHHQHQYQEQALQWFQPQEYNNFKLFTRVMVTENPNDNNATRLIIFDEPALEEYVIKNKTKFDIVFVKWDDSAGKALSLPITLAVDKKMAYTWDHRELGLKNIQVQIKELDHSRVVIPIDKCSETSRTTGKLAKNILFRTGQYVFQSFVQFNSQGSTKILSITQSDNRPQVSQMISWPHQRNQHAANDDDHDHGCQDSEHEAENENHNLKKEGYKLHADFKGIGFTFIDNVPKELLFMCFNRLVVNYTSVSQPSKMEDGISESTNTKTDVQLTLDNFQIDNLVDEEMPVLLGAQKYYSRNLERQCCANVESNLSKFYRFIPEDDAWFSKSKKPKKAKESTTKRSEALAKQMAANEQQQDGYDEPVPFVKVAVESSQKTHAGKLGTILRYEKITFGIQEFFLQIESAIMNENFKLIMDIIDIFSESGEEDIMTNDEEYEKALLMFRRDQCALVDASQGVVFDASSIKVDKITFGVIQIAAIRISLTFKLKLQMLDFDIENPRALFGLMNIIYPFLSQLASITDARIRFNELIILEGFYSQEQLAKNIQSSYYNQGIRQFFKILGSSDIMGNPTGLIDKVGLGVIELARDPIEGIQQGPEAFLTGLRTGVQGIIKGVIGGSFESLSLISGSLYDVVKQTSGNEDTRHDNATNIVDGVYYGLKGIGIEVYQGARGLIVKPWEGYKYGGKKGLVKGLGAGLAGAATTPVTGVLRAGQSVSQGISGTANDIGNIGKTRLEKLDVKLFRNRPPRRIDLRGQIRVYNEDMAIINRLLTKIKLANETLFQNQIIRFYALVPSIDQHGQIKQNLKYLIVITNQYLIYFEVFNFLDLQVKKYLQKSLILSEELTNIVGYNIKKRPSHITQPEDKATGKNQVAMYVKPQYFLTIIFKKPKAKNSNPMRSQPKEPEAQMPPAEKHWQPSAPAGAARLASGPREAGLALDVIEEEKEDHGQAPLGQLSQRDNQGFNGSAAAQRDERGHLDQLDGAEGPSTSHHHGQASYASRSLSKQDFNLAHMGAGSEDTFVEDRDSKAKYRYIFFSPSIEIFNRMHQIFTTLPEIHENIQEAQREKAERLAARKAQRPAKPQKANYFN